MVSRNWIEPELVIKVESVNFKSVWESMLKKAEIYCYLAMECVRSIILEILW